MSHFRESTTITTVLPSEGASLVMKSIDMCNQGTGRERKRPLGVCLGVLAWAHSGQAAMYSFTSFSRDGHQKRCCKR